MAKLNKSMVVKGTSQFRNKKASNQMFSNPVLLVPDHYGIDSNLLSIQCCPHSLTASSLSGLYHPAGVCANLFGTAVHQS